MEFVIQTEPNVLALRGEIDLHESPILKARFLELLERKPSQVFVDLSEVGFMDSSGLAVLIEMMQRIHSYGGELAFYGVRENLRSILHISRLDRVFRIFPNKAAAIAAVG